MYHGFNEEGFKNYLVEEKEGFDSASIMGLVDNIIDYAHKNNHIAKDNFAECISDIMRLDFGEVAMFCEDAILTKWGIEQKGMTLAKNGFPITDGPAQM